MSRQIFASKHIFGGARCKMPTHRRHAAPLCSVEYSYLVPEAALRCVFRLTASRLQWSRQKHALALSLWPDARCGQGQKNILRTRECVVTCPIRIEAQNYCDVIYRKVPEKCSYTYKSYAPSRIIATRGQKKCIIVRWACVRASSVTSYIAFVACV